MNLNLNRFKPLGETIYGFAPGQAISKKPSAGLTKAAPKASSKG